jgi:hypothetical protein
MSEFVIPWLTLQPIPVLALGFTLILELLDVVAARIAVVFSPVITIAVALAQLIADLVSDLPHLVDGDVRVLAPVCVVSASIHNRRTKQKR